VSDTDRASWDPAGVIRANTLHGDKLTGCDLAGVTCTNNA
jgi:hypothetical protein